MQGIYPRAVHYRFEEIRIDTPEIIERSTVSELHPGRDKLYIIVAALIDNVHRHIYQSFGELLYRHFHYYYFIAESKVEPLRLLYIHRRFYGLFYLIYPDRLGGYVLQPAQRSLRPGYGNTVGRI